jgi:hypothetical protein
VGVHYGTVVNFDSERGYGFCAADAPALVGLVLHVAADDFDLHSLDRWSEILNGQLCRDYRAWSANIRINALNARHIGQYANLDRAVRILSIGATARHNSRDQDDAVDCPHCVPLLPRRDTSSCSRGYKEHRRPFFGITSPSIYGQDDPNDLPSERLQAQLVPLSHNKTCAAFLVSVIRLK